MLGLGDTSYSSIHGEPHDEKESFEAKKRGGNEEFFMIGRGSKPKDGSHPQDNSKPGMTHIFEALNTPPGEDKLKLAKVEEDLKFVDVGDSKELIEERITAC